MALKATQYDEVGQAQHVTKLERDVRTPVKHDVEKNQQTVYEVEGQGYIKVSKISNLGWRVTLYDEDGELEDFHRPRLEDEETAHKVARQYVDDTGDN